MNPSIMLGLNEITFNAITSTGSSENSLFSHTALFSGFKNQFWQAATSNNSSIITFDLGSGNKDSCEFLILGGANLLTALVSGEIDINLEASTDNFSSSVVLIAQKVNLATTDLIGPKSDDFLINFGNSGEYRYWRVAISSTSTYLYSLRKVCFGKWFRFGEKDPFYPYSTSPLQSQNPFVGGSGSAFNYVSRPNQKTYSFQWRVDDDTRDEFESTVVDKLRDNTAWLYTSDSTFRNPLNGHEIVGVRMTGYSSNSGQNIRDNNIISLSFVEDLP